MSQEIKEQLSAFMDGELGRDQARFLLKRAEGDRDTVHRWTRYHVIRQTLRRQDIVALRIDFAGAVMARLDGEAVVQARGTTWLRWGGGGAIAAAVAVAALMVTKPANEPAQIAGTNAATARSALAPTQVASTHPLDARTPQMVPNSPIPSAVASFGTDVAQPGSYDPRLQSYVIRHYQATGSTSQPDFVPYILLAPPADALEARQVENR
jgi:sigma-E factor negative regulatory protein RseA